jgi:hypothetical protein
VGRDLFSRSQVKEGVIGCIDPSIVDLSTGHLHAPAAVPPPKKYPVPTE